MKTHKTQILNALGIVLGFLLFVCLVPVVMWLVSGMPALWPVSPFRLFVVSLIAIVGLALSVWTIIYIKQRGKGNPMDAFGHELAPRTQHLMVDGPYSINRNPSDIALPDRKMLCQNMSAALCSNRWDICQ